MCLDLINVGGRCVDFVIVPKVSVPFGAEG